MVIRSAAVLGAGAVGSYFIYALMNKEGIDFSVVAEGERKARLERDGILIDDRKQVRTFRPAVKTPEEARGVDLLLVAVKYTALEGSLDAIRRIAAPGTIVLSVLNGIDSEEIIGSVIDPSQIVYSLVRVSSERRACEDGRSLVSFDPTLKWGIYLGEKGSPVKSERIEAIEKLFEGTSCNTYFTTITLTFRKSTTVPTDIEQNVRF